MIGGRYENWVTSSEEFESRFDCETGSDACSKEGKRKRLWKKVKYQLVEYHSLTEYLRDNEFIIGYYRSEWPLKQVFLSIFSIHNETLNIWTHLIGFFLFLCLTAYTATKAPKTMYLDSLQRLPDLVRRAHELHGIPSDILNCLPPLPSMPDLHKLKDDFKTSLPSLSGWNLPELLTSCLPQQFSHTNLTDNSVVLSHGLKDLANMAAPVVVSPTARWPFFAFLSGAMFCLLASSTCHLLYCHSERLSYVMCRIDYAGIAVLISTSFYPPVYYSFVCSPFLCCLYLASITILALATIVFSLLPSFQKPEFRRFRASLFFGMGLSGLAPILHKLILYRNQKEVLQTTCYEVLMGLFYGLGALVYTARVPERWRPGKFDIAGHSHQLFHVLVVAGAYTHYCAGLVYLQWRDLQGC